LNSATKSPTEKLYQLLHGFNSYYAGDFSKAISNFNNFDQKDSQYFTIAQIGLAQSHFMLRKFETAL
jgi:outer membrane protein assembly factor BamD (BamD/ComL family)